MAGLFEYLGEHDQLWERCSFTSVDNFETLEVWTDSSSCQPSSTTLKRTIDNKDVRSWLSEHRDESLPQGNPIKRCTLRLVWAVLDRPSRTVNIHSTTMTDILEEFQLVSAYAYATSSYAGIAHVSSSLDDPLRVYSFCNHPKFILLWSWNSVRNITQAICMATSEQISTLKNLLSYDWRINSHELLLPFIIATSLSIGVDQAQTSVKDLVRKIEVATGHHCWKSRTEVPARGDPHNLSTKVNGYAMKMASEIRKLKVIEEVIQFSLERLDQMKRSRNSENEILTRNFAVLQRRARMQHADAEFFQQRIEKQLNALYNIVNQANAARYVEIAMDSRIIALSSQRDSSSMKTLAVVTMVFLPPTFVSQLFSMPLFNWSAYMDGKLSPITSALNIYAGVAIPLTLATLSTWLLWTFFEFTKHRRENDDARARLRNGLQTTRDHDDGAGVVGANGRSK